MSALDQHHTHQGAVPFLDGPIKMCSLVIGHCTLAKLNARCITRLASVRGLCLRQNSKN